MASIEELRAALADVCTSHEAYGIDEHIDKAVELVDNALVELAALRAQVEGLRPVLVRLSDSMECLMRLEGHTHNWSCRYCRARHTHMAELQHKPACPVTIARKILASQSATPE